MTEKLQFIIEVDDKGSATIKQFGATVQETTGKIQGMGSALEVIKWGAIIGMAEKALSTFKKFYELAELGATVKSLENSFTLMTQNAGIAGDALMKKMKEVTNSTVDDSDLIKKANRLIAEGFSAEQIIHVGEAARVAARLMGTEVSAA